MLLTFKMSNGNGAHQDPCQKTYLLFPNISLPLTSLPVDCKHSPFQATSLQKHGELLTAIGSVMYCVVRLSALYTEQKQAWGEHATYLQNEERKRSTSRSLSEDLFAVS